MAKVGDIVIETLEARGMMPNGVEGNSMGLSWFTSEL